MGLLIMKLGKLKKYVLLENGSIQKTKYPNEEYRGFRYKGKDLFMDYLERFMRGYLYKTSKVIATSDNKEELEGMKNNE